VGQTPEQGQENQAQNADGCADVDAGVTFPPVLLGLGPASPEGFALYQNSYI